MIVSDALGFHGFGRPRRARASDGTQDASARVAIAEFDALVPPEQQVSADFASAVPAPRLPRSIERPASTRPATRSGTPETPIHLFQQYAVTAQGYTAIAEKLLAEPYDLFLVYYEQVDSFSHLFMKHAAPKLDWISEEDHARFKDVVHEWYAYQDELLGEPAGGKSTSIPRRSSCSRTTASRAANRRIRSEQTGRHQARRTSTTSRTASSSPRGRRHPARRDGSRTLPCWTSHRRCCTTWGWPVGKDMDGKVLEGVFDEAFVAANPIRYVSSYEVGREPADEAPPVDAGDQAEIERGLAALGYLGGEDGEPAAEGDTTATAEESSPEIHNNLGRIHLRNGELDEALAEFQKALGRDPENAEALLNIGHIHQGQGKSDLAEHFVQRALAVDPNSVSALAQLAEVRRDQDQLGEAIRLFAVALEIDDSQPFLYMGVGDVLQRAGRYEEAVRAFQHVLELDPDSFKARYNLGVTYANMGRPAEAAAIYEEALELAPKDFEAPAARNNLGALFLAAGETERALEQFEAALEGAPHNLEARYNAALIYLGTGRTEEAILRLREAARLRPDHRQVNVRLGLAYLAAGRGEEAYKPLLLARRLYPADWAATVGLAVLHAHAGEADTARQLTSEALAAGGDEARGLADGYPVLERFLP